MLSKGCAEQGTGSREQRGQGREKGEAAHAKKCAGHGSSRSISQDFRMLLPLVGPHKRTSRTWSAINVNVEIFMMQPPLAQRGTERHRVTQRGSQQRGVARGECATLFMRYLSFERNLNNPVQGTRIHTHTHTGTHTGTGTGIQHTVHPRLDAALATKATFQFLSNSYAGRVCQIKNLCCSRIKIIHATGCRQRQWLRLRQWQRQGLRQWQRQWQQLI